MSAPRLALRWPEDAAWADGQDARTPRCVLHAPDAPPPTGWRPELPRVLWLGADAQPPQTLQTLQTLQKTPDGPIAALVATLADDELDEEIELVLTTFSRRETMSR